MTKTQGANCFQRFDSTLYRFTFVFPSSSEPPSTIFRGFLVDFPGEVPDRPENANHGEFRFQHQSGVYPLRPRHFCLIQVAPHASFCMIIFLRPVIMEAFVILLAFRDPDVIN